jgi:hypothetical protein
MKSPGGDREAPDDLGVIEVAVIPPARRLP